MFKKIVLILAIASFTSLLTLCLTSCYYIKKEKEYLNFLTFEGNDKNFGLSKENKTFELSKEDGQIYAGVVFENVSLTSENKKNKDRAINSLSKIFSKEWLLYVTTRKIPENKTIFVFKVSPTSDGKFVAE